MRRAVSDIGGISRPVRAVTPIKTLGSRARWLAGSRRAINAERGRSDESVTVAGEAAIVNVTVIGSVEAGQRPVETANNATRAVAAVQMTVAEVAGEMTAGETARAMIAGVPGSIRLAHRREVPDRIPIHRLPL